MTDENVLPVNTRGFDPCADFLLVVVDGSSINVSISCFQGYLDGILDLIRC